MQNSNDYSLEEAAYNKGKNDEQERILNIVKAVLLDELDKASWSSIALSEIFQKVKG